jgi:putative AlgH/UPF0301 family transcriptional regulator
MPNTGIQIIYKKLRAGTDIDTGIKFLLRKETASAPGGPVGRERQWQVHTRMEGIFRDNIIMHDHIKVVCASPCSDGSTRRRLFLAYVPS